MVYDNPINNPLNPPLLMGNLNRKGGTLKFPINKGNVIELRNKGIEAGTEGKYSVKTSYTCHSRMFLAGIQVCVDGTRFPLKTCGNDKLVLTEVRNEKRITSLPNIYHRGLLLFLNSMTLPPAGGQGGILASKVSPDALFYTKDGFMFREGLPKHRQ